MNRELRIYRCTKEYYILTFCVAILLFFFVTSCASYTNKYDLSKLSDNSSHDITKENLNVMIRPVTESNLNNKIFHTNLFNDGFIPVYIIVKNMDLSNRFAMRKKQCNLSNNKSYTSEGAYGGTKLSKNNQSVMESTSLASAALLCSPILAINSAIMHKQAAARRSITESQYKEKVIRPNESNSGFLYFKFDTSNQNIDRYNLHLEFVNMESNETIVFNFPIKLGD